MQRHIPVTLQRVAFKRTHIECLEYKDPDGTAPIENFPIHSSMNVLTNPENPLEFAVTLTLQGNMESDPAFPYRIEVECVALLTRDAELPEDLTEGAVHTLLVRTGHSVCVGAVREYISMLTGRHLFGPMMTGLIGLHLQKAAPPTEQQQELAAP